MLSIAPLPNQFLHRVRTENRDDLAPDSADATMRAFFASPDVAFLHLRFPTYGCFACRVDRAVTSGSAQ